MSDASMYGYGQCWHLRLKEEKGKVHISFVMGKAGMTPKTTVSILRLELATATLSVEIGEILKNELEYGNNEDYWMDSKAVVGFISNESSHFHIYLANRVQLIHDDATPALRHYVDSTSNTTDKGSRGMSLKDFVENQNGLRFLTSSENLK